MTTMTLEQLVAIEGYADEYGTVTDEMLTLLIDFANTHLSQHSGGGEVDQHWPYGVGVYGPANQVVPDAKTRDTVSQKGERFWFEAWARGQGFNVQRNVGALPHGGEYATRDTSNAWEGWAGRAALAHPRPVVPDALKPGWINDQMYRDEKYARGWNACLAKVRELNGLAAAPESGGV